ncbi:hypothetical protein AYO45_01380 [Gammaproteobacteria bacterium SCGC AG-212-F23]|nr:hypothetical protein AYO45_01380 [Gammaproteobacteria bacterium SCGC AG-212-F23]
MKRKFRLLTLGLLSLSVPFLIFATNASAQSFSLHKHSSYNNGYDDGYDDGYDEAMDDCPCPPYYYGLGGFYLGAGLGYEGFQIHRNPSILDNPYGTFNTHANGWNGRLMGGYGATFYNNYYLGGEAFIGTTGASGKDSVNALGGMMPYKGKFSAGTSYGVSVLPGYKLNSGSLVYARLGFIQTDFKVNDWSNTLGSNMTNWTSGFDTGIGFEIPIYNKISAKLEYEYINYNSFNHNGTVSSSNSPVDNRGSLSIAYHF